MAVKAHGPEAVDRKQASDEAAEVASTEVQDLAESKAVEVEVAKGQPDLLAEPTTYEVVAKDYDVSPNDLSITVGRAYAALKDEHGGDHGNQYTVKVASSQPDNLADPKTVERTTEPQQSTESKTVEVVSSQVDHSAEPWTVEVVAKDRLVM